ncbi:hypothetical protein JL720_10122 [Aureococcus anophagefferens]|nr:hypothetical protein JL720_10122 [Aureococcus anophagefferens]
MPAGISKETNELAFLVGLRGRRGVPLLLGGWLERGLPTLVVADAGRSLAAGRTVTANGASAGDSRKLNIDGGYAALARAEPLALAVAILECFESFAGVGGLFLEDFRSDQFAYAADPVSFALVDGPRPLDDDRPRRWSSRSDAPRPCAADADCPPTRAYHCCCRGVSRDDRGCAAGAGPCHCDANTTAAPEAAGLCRRGTCAPITAQTHAFDVAADLAAGPRPPGGARAAARLLADMRAADGRPAVVRRRARAASAAAALRLPRLPVAKAPKAKRRALRAAAVASASLAQRAVASTVEAALPAAEVAAEATLVVARGPSPLLNAVRGLATAVFAFSIVNAAAKAVERRARAAVERGSAKKKPRKVLDVFRKKPARPVELEELLTVPAEAALEGPAVAARRFSVAVAGLLISAIPNALVVSPGLQSQLVAPWVAARDARAVAAPAVDAGLERWKAYSASVGPASHYDFGARATDAARDHEATAIPGAGLAGAWAAQCAATAA